VLQNYQSLSCQAELLYSHHFFILWISTMCGNMCMDFLFELCSSTFCLTTNRVGQNCRPPALYENTGREICE